MSRRLPYTGRYTVQLDAKHRAILPAALRKLAEQEMMEEGDSSGEFYLTYYAQGCLHLYTAVGFRRQLDLWRTNLDATEDDEEFEEMKDHYDEFLHDSVNLKLGEQGRLLVPVELFEKSGLTEGEPVVVVGSDTVIELWSKEKYDERFAKLRHDPQRAERAKLKLSRRRVGGASTRKGTEGKSEEE